jgi:ATP-binding cassette subfamily C protein PrsD
MMNEGRLQAFGPKEEVLGKVLRQQQTDRPSPLKIVSEGQEAKQ